MVSYMDASADGKLAFRRNDTHRKVVHTFEGNDLLMHVASIEVVGISREVPKKNKMVLMHH